MTWFWYFVNTGLIGGMVAMVILAHVLNVTGELKSRSLER